ncbi:unnamed protein product [Discosporangium mesarthrocarpum]
MEARCQDKQRKKLEELEEEERKWFNPSTAHRSKALLLKTMPERLTEGTEERIRRMARVQDHRKRRLIEQARVEHERQCTFKPQLNRVTQALGQKNPKTPLDELVHNRRGQRVRAKAEDKARKDDTCTHIPSLVAEQALVKGRGAHQATKSTPILSGLRQGGLLLGSPNNGTDVTQVPEPGPGDPESVAALYGSDNKFRLPVKEPWKISKQIREREREQAEKMSILRAEREMAEMQPCTFAPATNKAKLPQGCRPVVVRGLGRHLELRDVAQQKEEERKRREALAFGVKPGAVRRSALGETVVEPFLLSGGRSQGWWGERRRKREEEEKKACTFRPWTVEAERSQVLGQLLEWSSIMSSGGGLEEDDRS